MWGGCTAVWLDNSIIWLQVASWCTKHASIFWWLCGHHLLIQRVANWSKEESHWQESSWWLSWLCAGSRGMPWLDAHPSCASVSYQPSPTLASIPFLYCSPCLFSLNAFHEDIQTVFTLSQCFSWFCTSWAFIDSSLFCLLHAYQFNIWTLHGITVLICDTDTICTRCWYLFSYLTSTWQML